MKTLRLCAATVLSVAALFASVPANAAVLAESPFVELNGANNYFTQERNTGAENFSLSAAAVIDKISFSAFYDPLSPQASSVAWSIRNSAGTVPVPGNAVIARGTDAFTVHHVGQVAGSAFQIFDYVVDIADLALDAGEYWLGFHLNGSNGGTHWMRSSVDRHGALSTDNGVSWKESDWGLLFRIEGSNAVSDPPAAVSEPVSIALLGLGLLGLPVFRRRIQN